MMSFNKWFSMTILLLDIWKKHLSLEVKYISLIICAHLRLESSDKDMHEIGLKSILFHHDEESKCSNSKILIHKTSMISSSSSTSSLSSSSSSSQSLPPPPPLASSSSSSSSSLSSSLSLLSLGSSPSSSSLVDHDMIGTESGFHSMQINDELMINCKRVSHKVSKGVRKRYKPKVLLPTLTCMQEMTTIKLRRKCVDGGLILEAERIDVHQSRYFETYRENGKLVLNLILPFEAKDLDSIGEDLTSI